MTPQERKNFEAIRDNVHGEMTPQEQRLYDAGYTNGYMDCSKKLHEQSTEQEPVAWLLWLYSPVRVFLNKDEAMMEFNRLNREYPVDNDSRQMKPLYTQPQEHLERLCRIMGTFDLATGHAETMDDALDSLESELRDVLGHYREAFKNINTQRCPNCASLEAQNSELDAKLAEFEQEATRKPLTNEEILSLAQSHYSPHQRAEISFARAIEVAHGIGEKE